METENQRLLDKYEHISQQLSELFNVVPEGQKLYDHIIELLNDECSTALQQENIDDVCLFRKMGVRHIMSILNLYSNRKVFKHARARLEASSYWEAHAFPGLYEKTTEEEII